MLQRIFNRTGLTEGKQRYLLNTTWLIADRGIQMGVGLVLGILIARYLGPKGYGIYNYVISFVFLFSAIAGLGMQDIIVKDLVEKPEDENKIIGTALSLRFIASLVAFSLAVVISFVIEDAATVRYYMFLTAVPWLVKCVEVLTFYYQAKVISKYYVYAHMAGVLIASGLRVVLIVFNQPIIWFFYTFIIDAVIYIILLLVFYKKLGGRFRSWAYNRRYANLLIKRAWPLLFSAIVVMFYMRVDQVMIQKLLGSEFTGYYAAAVKLSAVWYAIPWLVASSLFPALLNAKKRSEAQFRLRLSRLYQGLIALAIVIIVPVTLLANPIITILFGEEYIQAATVLKVHIWAGVFVFIGHVGDKWLVSEGLQRYSILNTIPGAVLNVVLNYFFILKMGVVGAAWASLLSQVLTYHLMPLMFKPTRKIFWEQNLAIWRVLSLYELWQWLKNRNQA